MQTCPLNFSYFNNTIQSLNYSLNLSLQLVTVIVITIININYITTLVRTELFFTVSHYILQL